MPEKSVRLLGEIRHGAKVYKSGEASRWRVCYQQGLPRLVSIQFKGRDFVSRLVAWTVHRCSENCI